MWLWSWSLYLFYAKIIVTKNGPKNIWICWWLCQVNTTHTQTHTHTQPERKYTLVGDSTYFEIYVFTKEKVDIVKELENYNCLHIERKKVLANSVPVSNKKKHPKFFVQLIQRKPLFSGVQKTTKQCLNSPIAIYFLKCVMKMEAWLGLSQSRRFHFYFVLTMKT